MNLNVASEYLTMSAELIEIKSSMLLPKKNKINEEDEIFDARENLINRLLEYEKYKEVTETLKTLEESRKKIFCKEATDLTVYNVEEELEENFNIDDLVEAVNKMLERKDFEKPLNTKIEKREFAIVTMPTVTVKGSPADSGTELFVIHEGTKVKVKSSLSGWYEIEIADGNVGWLQSSAIVII